MPFVIIRRALAATPRSSPDLLTLPYPFSQVKLLTPEEFVREAERRQSYGMVNIQVPELPVRSGM